MARKMKNSGIEWIGEIPFDWEITTIKRIFTLFAGATPKSEILLWQLNNATYAMNLCLFLI